MNTIADAITWSEPGVTLSLFAIYRGPPAPGDFAPSALPEHQLRRYLLDDELSLLPGGSVIEYDLVFRTLPSNLRECLASVLRSARSSGAVVAWLGFEGSFHFEHLLTEDVANQIYAVADEEGVTLADDVSIHTKSWRARVLRTGVHARSALLG